MTRRLFFAFAFMLFAIGCAHGQRSIDPKCAGDLSTDAAWHLGEIHAVCAGKTAQTCEIKADLEDIDSKCGEIEKECPGADKLLDDLFGCTRHRRFANYILYFEQPGDAGAGAFNDGPHLPVLMWKSKNTRYLYGVEEVYILILSEHKFCVTARATTIFKNEPNPLPSILKLLGKDTGISDTQTGLKAQKEPSFIWYPLNGDPDPDKSTMWLAIGAVPMDVNTNDWITVQAKQPVARTDKNPDLPDECTLHPGTPARYTSTALAHNAFFSDNRWTRGGLGVAIGATLPGRKLAAGGVANPTLDGFLLGEFFVKRPTLESDPDTAPGERKYRSPPSWAVALGTNIGFGSASAFDDLIGGVVAGHVFSSNVGVMAGVSYLLAAKPTDVVMTSAATTATTTVPKARHLRPFVGIEYSF